LNFWLLQRQAEQRRTLRSWLTDGAAAKWGPRGGAAIVRSVGTGDVHVFALPMRLLGPLTACSSHLSHFLTSGVCTGERSGLTFFLCFLLPFYFVFVSICSFVRNSGHQIGGNHDLHPPGLDDDVVPSSAAADRSRSGARWPHRPANWRWALTTTRLRPTPPPTWLHIAKQGFCLAQHLTIGRNTRGDRASRRQLRRRY
jgi:hypothetical protein